MSGFNLPANFNSNPEALLRKKRTRVVSSSSTPLTVEPITPAPSVSTTMARSLRDYSTPLLPMCPLGPQSTLGMETSSFALAYLRWCRQTSFVVCQVRTQTRIYRTSLSYEKPSSSRMSHLKASSSACFPSPSRGRRSNGSTRARKLSNTWDKCFAAFLVKFCPMSKTNALRGKISNF